MKILKVIGIFIFGSLAFVGITQRDVPGGENNIYLGIICLILAILLVFSLTRKRITYSNKTEILSSQQNNQINYSTDIINSTTQNESYSGIQLEHINNVRNIYLFLKWCKNHHSVLPTEQYPAYMQYSWEIKNPIHFHLQLIQEGYLVEMTAQQKIQNLKVVDLKNILKSQGLPVSGKKQELIERIFNHVDQVLINNFLDGKKEYCLSKKAIDFLSKYHDISSIHNARHDIDNYTADGVEKYQILATLDNKTCDICGELDGKIFLVKDAVIGLNSPPFHQGCRCTTIPYYDDTPTEELTRVARDPETGKTYEVPADMTWKEWKEKYL